MKWLQTLCRTVSVLGLAALVIAAVPQTGVHAEGPASIKFKHAGLYPEGLEYDSGSGRFFVSSIYEGTVYAVDDKGNIKPFIQDDKLISTAGLRIDTRRGRLIVTNLDAGVSKRSDPKTINKTAGIGIYSLADGKPITYIDLASLDTAGDKQHLANDIALDGQGNIYVTDSYAPVIYKVDFSGKASVFLRDPRLGDQPGFNANGIVYHPGGYLLVDKTNDGILWKIPLDDPTRISQVQLDQKINQCDGLVIKSDGSIYALVNAKNLVLSISSSDDWATAKVDASLPTQTPTAFPASGVIRDGILYTNITGLDKLFDPNNKTVVEEFGIEAVKPGK